MNKRKAGTPIDIQDYPVDSRYPSKADSIHDGQALMEARLEQMKKMPADEIVQARLLQLKLRIDSYLEQPESEQAYSFTGFLKQYLDTLYSRRSVFAKDMEISAVSLSQVLNGHREPKVEFMQRLILHSERVYKNVCQFPRDTWFRVYYHGKIIELMDNQKHRWLEEGKHVQLSEPMEKYGRLLGD